MTAPSREELAQRLIGRTWRIPPGHYRFGTGRLLLRVQAVLELRSYDNELWVYVRGNQADSGALVEAGRQVLLRVASIGTHIQPVGQQPVAEPGGHVNGRPPFTPRTFMLSVGAGDDDTPADDDVVAYGMTLPDGSALVVGTGGDTATTALCTSAYTAARLYAADLVWTRCLDCGSDSHTTDRAGDA